MRSGKGLTRAALDRRLVLLYSKDEQTYSLGSSPDAFSKRSRKGPFSTPSSTWGVLGGPFCVETRKLLPSTDTSRRVGERS